ncbi:hypothetical protein [Bacillus sp. 165]|uniref:hypothetical protein n=1 Tax=Bacillus sp. 165 TaxID=1529117 RepID=UPI001ADC4D5E|nr:hypothetical protein [Bacillus sp. 165]MBO9128095.1 hypothetical protein [Bacillus sp. 165]
MKKMGMVLLTIAMEAVLLWVVSMVFGWKFMDTVFLGGLVIFGVIWLFNLAVNQSNNVNNAVVKGWTGQDAGEIKKFELKMSPFILGLVLFIVISFAATIIHYSSYFFS